jgi:hypothetical protein
MFKGRHAQEDISPEAHVRLMDPDEAPTDFLLITDMGQTVERLLTEALEDGTIGDWNLVFRRCAIILMADPNEYGTPVRCPVCEGVYYVLPEEPFNLTLAGFEFTPCIDCMIRKFPAPPELEAAHEEEEDLGWRQNMALIDVHDPDPKEKDGEEPEGEQQPERADPVQGQERPDGGAPEPEPLDEAGVTGGTEESGFIA